MGNWNRVKWTVAGQIGELLEWPADLEGQAGATPSRYFDWLRQNGRLNDAAFFLGQALPRFETVAWAASVVRDAGGGEADGTLGATLAWVRDPSEANRRAAHDASTVAPQTSPARLAALAAFFSGGSMSPEGQPPVPAPRAAAGRFAAGAVLLAAIQSADQTVTLTKALAAGDAIAAGGVQADAF
jgi:hypothetical protein